ncbi:hypothetical protein L1987_38145 [Smallanthus sonchifolius]|uniref:Uncharacterized protein n=1 Tax=Smallanthus sonchifolius TaxID=185202 RepID=A0ACB9HJR8_9ASTR|nr:hypothetical protein L1987_38145 [Smallanthus sonchifolius]
MRVTTPPRSPPPTSYCPGHHGSLPASCYTTTSIATLPPSRRSFLAQFHGRTPPLFTAATASHHSLPRAPSPACCHRHSFQHGVAVVATIGPHPRLG